MYRAGGGRGGTGGRLTLECRKQRRGRRPQRHPGARLGHQPSPSAPPQGRGRGPPGSWLSPWCLDSVLPSTQWVSGEAPTPPEGPAPTGHVPSAPGHPQRGSLEPHMCEGFPEGQGDWVRGVFPGAGTQWPEGPGVRVGKAGAAGWGRGGRGAGEGRLQSQEWTVLASERPPQPRQPSIHPGGGAQGRVMRTSGPTGCRPPSLTAPRAPGAPVGSGSGWGGWLRRTWLTRVTWKPTPGTRGRGGVWTC